MGRQAVRWSRSGGEWLAWACCLLGAGWPALGYAQDANSTSPAATRYEFLADQMVPMRDGVKLATHIYRPRDSSPHPVILMRTPYGKPGPENADAARLTDAGYVVVVQDCRGRGKSEGVWDPFRYDPEDGFDTQQWVGAQAWCNGSIGTQGGSYVGWTQWASAPLASPYLKTMVPIVPFGDPYDEITYPGGAFQLSLAFGWGVAVGGIQVSPPQLAEAYRHLPLQNWDSQFGRDVFYLDQWVAHATPDDYWQQRGIQHRYEQIKIPVLNIGGWYDIFSKTTIELVDRVRAQSQDHLARRNQFVVMGPWAHGVGAQKVGDLDFGPESKLDLGKLQRDWFDYWLLNRDTGVEDWPAYRIFVMGENQWRSENEWPLARTQWTPYYLHSGGKANTLHGDGSLSTVEPMDEPEDTFTYDANQPVPTTGGNNLVGVPIGPFDQTEVEGRADVLVYTTEPLTKATEVTGPLKCVLFAASSAVDTDFTAKLIDVYPDGKAFNLADGIVRARYRESKTSPTLIEAGKCYRYEIDLWVTSNVFLPGHRIRVEISSSNFPRFDRNPNTGEPFGAGTDLKSANQTIYHDAERASHLLLPIIPR